MAVNLSAKCRRASALVLAGGLALPGLLLAGPWFCGRDAAAEHRRLAARLREVARAPQDPDPFLAAVAAFRAAGTNGVPVLARELRRKNSLPERLLSELLRQPVPDALRYRLVPVLTRLEVRRQQALAVTVFAHAIPELPADRLPAGAARVDWPGPWLPDLSADPVFRDTTLADDLAWMAVHGRSGWCRAMSGVLVALGERGVGALLPHLRDPRPRVSEAAVRRIASLVSVGRPAPPKLTVELRDWLLAHPAASMHSRYCALRALRQLGPEAGAALPAVLGLLRQRPEDAPVRSLACEVLGQIAGEPEACVPLLRQHLGDAHDTVRAAAARSLGAFGAAARAAVPELAACLADASPGVQVAAATALGRLGPDTGGAGAELLRLTHAQNPGVRAAAVCALGRVRAGGPEVLKRLVALLDDPAEPVRAEAATALGLLGPVAAPAVEALGRALEDPALPVRIRAVQALGRIGPAARSEVPQLQAARSNDQSGLGRLVAEALAAIEGEAAEVRQAGPAPVPGP